MFRGRNVEFTINVPSTLRIVRACLLARINSYYHIKAHKTCHFPFFSPFDSLHAIGLYVRECVNMDRGFKTESFGKSGRLDGQYLMSPTMNYNLQTWGRFTTKRGWGTYTTMVVGCYSSFASVQIGTSWKTTECDRCKTKFILSFSCVVGKCMVLRVISSPRLTGFDYKYWTTLLLMFGLRCEIREGGRSKSVVVITSKASMPPME